MNIASITEEEIDQAVDNMIVSAEVAKLLRKGIFRIGPVNTRILQRFLETNRA